MRISNRQKLSEDEFENLAVKIQGYNNEMSISSVSIVCSCVFMCECTKKTFSEKRKQTHNSHIIGVAKGEKRINGTEEIIRGIMQKQLFGRIKT